MCEIISTRALHPENMKNAHQLRTENIKYPEKPSKRNEGLHPVHPASTSRERYMWWIIYPAIW
jgi:hypothetical protein